MMEKENSNKKPGERWTVPAGYESALKKAQRLAREAAGIKPKPKAKAKSRPVKAALPHPDTASEDSEDSSDDGFPDICAAVRRHRYAQVTKGTSIRRAPIKPSSTSDPHVTNSFSDLIYDIQIYDPQTLATVQEWNVKVVKDSEKMPQKDRKKLTRGRAKIDRMANYINGPKKPDMSYPPVVQC